MTANLVSNSINDCKDFFRINSPPIHEANLDLLVTHLKQKIDADSDLTYQGKQNLLSYISSACAEMNKRKLVVLNMENYVKIRSAIPQIVRPSEPNYVIVYGLTILASYLAFGTYKLDPKIRFVSAKSKVSPFFKTTNFYKDIESVISYLKDNNLRVTNQGFYQTILYEFCIFAEARLKTEIDAKLITDFINSGLSDTKRRFFTQAMVHLCKDKKLYFENPLIRFEPLIPLRMPTYDEALQRLKSEPSDLSSLMALALQKLKEYGESKSSIGQVEKIYRRFRWFCFKRHIEVLRDEMCDAYLKFEEDLLTAGEQKEWKFNEATRAIKILKRVSQKGYIPKDIFKISRLGPLEPWISDFRQSNFKILCEERQYSISHANHYDFVFRTIIRVCSIESKDELKKLTPHDIAIVQEYFVSRCSKDSMVSICKTLKWVVNDLYKRKLIDIDLSPYIIKPYRLRSYNPSYLNMDNQAVMQRAILDLSSRNYCLIYLAFALGLRQIDIVSLRLSNFDFKRKKIRLVQHKTSKPMTLPLFDDFVKKLNHYIKVERQRPYCDDERIFLSDHPPFDPITDIYHITKKLLTQYHLQSENKGELGPHMLRKSLVHALLHTKTPHIVITDTLGHSSGSSDLPYLSMNDDMLKQCSLDLSLIGKGTLCK